MEHLLSLQTGEHLALIVVARLLLNGAAHGLRIWLGAEVGLARTLQTLLSR